MLFTHKGWLMVFKDEDKKPPNPKEVQEDLLNNPNESLIAISTLSYKGNEDNEIFEPFMDLEGRKPFYAIFLIGYSPTQFYC